MAEVRTILRVVQLATKHLDESGVDTPRLDAELLLGHVLGLDRIHLYVQHDRPLTPSELSAYREFVARRARREPVAYILGEREFFSLSFAVDGRVLVPRPETEHLVEASLERLRKRFPGRPHLAFADIGTGSGAVVVTMLHSEERATAVATDISDEAIKVAAQNAERHGVSDRVTFRTGDLFGPLAGERFHAIISNPPYICESDLAGLPTEVKEYEPVTALTAGSDGLDIIRRLIAGAAEHLLPGGFLALEIGADQGESVLQIAHGQGLKNARLLPDLAGKDRVAVIEMTGDTTP